MLEVVRQLLEDNERSGEPLAIFTKLVARNSQLELRLSELLARQRKGEGVSTAQLLLLVNQQQAREETSGENDFGARALQPCRRSGQRAAASAAGVDE